MSDELRLIVRRCRHGAWAAHNAYRLDDGSVIDDPEGQCRGGVVEVEGGRTAHISHALAWALDSLTRADHTEGET